MKSYCYAQSTMHMKGDAELNRGGAGDPHSPCDSDLSATSAPRGW